MKKKSPILLTIVVALNLVKTRSQQTMKKKSPILLTEVVALNQVETRSQQTMNKKSPVLLTVVVALNLVETRSHKPCRKEAHFVHHRFRSQPSYLGQRCVRFEGSRFIGGLKGLRCCDLEGLRTYVGLLDSRFKVWVWGSRV